MQTIELKFKPKQMVWLMYSNKVTCAHVSEVRLTGASKAQYYFWHESFSTRDSTFVDNNLFRINENLLFETKEELLKSL